MKTYIKAISYYLPEKIINNEELVKDFPDWSVDKIASKIGINERHIANDEETSTDLAIKASEKLFNENLHLNKDDIDFVILCTQSPDYFLPTSACLIQDRLGLKTNIGAFDFNLGCSGYVYGLAVAKGLLCGGIAKNVLLLTAETYSKYLHPNDKSSRTIFADAASASIISNDGFAEIGDFSLGTDGRGANNLIVKSGASRCPLRQNDLSFDEKGNPISSDHLYMNGTEIFKFTSGAVPELVTDVLMKNQLKKENINLFVFHQANKFMLEMIRKKLKLESAQVPYSMIKYGNTSSASIPLTLSLLGNEARNKKIAMCGFGVGLSIGSGYFETGDVFVNEIIEYEGY